MFICLVVLKLLFYILRILFDRMGGDIIYFSPAWCFILPFIIYFSYLLFYPQDPSPERDTGNEAAEKERMWVMRGRNSAIAVTCGWITWILFVQVIFPDSLPSSWYVRDPNSFAATGW